MDAAKTEAQTAIAARQHARAEELLAKRQARQHLPPPEAPSILVNKPPSIRVEHSGVKHDLPITRAAVEVSLSGPFFSVSTTLTFSNEADKQLEGKLEFPLPPNATVCGFATEIDGVLVDAAVVQKDKARKALETEVRAGGPAATLLEVTAGNCYRARIWPLLPKSTHTIRLDYCDALPLEAGAGTGLASRSETSLSASLLLRLSDFDLRSILGFLPPLDLAQAGRCCQRLSRFVAATTLTLPVFFGPGAEVVTRVAVTDVRGGGGVAPPYSFAGGVPLAFTVDDGTGTTVATHTSKPAGLVASSAALTIGVPALLGGRNIAFADDEHFAVVDAPLPASFLKRAAAVAAGDATAAPSIVGVAFDVSGSRTRKAVARELAVLRSVLATLPAATHIACMPFADAPVALNLAGREIGLIDNSAAGRDMLLTALADAPLDGGTNLGNPDMMTQSVAVGAQHWLLFSDGFSNVGPKTLPCLGAGVPTFAFSAEGKTEHAVLRHVAESSGGAFYAVGGGAFASDAAAAASVAERFSQHGRRVGLLRIEAEATAKAVHPSKPTALEVGGRMIVSGKFNNNNASGDGGAKKGGASRLRLVYGRLDGAGPTLTRHVTVYRGGGGGGGATPVGRHWAQQEAAAMKALPDKFASELLALGKRYGVVTKQTSLLVLRDLAQHLKHGIRPAAARAKLCAAYDERLATDAASEQERRDEKIGKVLVDMWRPRVTTWRADKRMKRPEVAPVVKAVTPMVQGLTCSFESVPYCGEYVVTATEQGGDKTAHTLVHKQSNWFSATSSPQRLSVTFDSLPAKTAFAVVVTARDTMDMGFSSPASAPVEVTTLAPEVAAPKMSSHAKAKKMKMKPMMASERCMARSARADCEGAMPPSAAMAMSMDVDAFACSSDDDECEEECEEEEGGAPRRMRARARPRGGGGGGPEAKEDVGGAGGERSAAAGGSISVKKWSPDTPYMKAIKAAMEAEGATAAAAAAYDAYLGEKAKASNAETPAFYLDCASAFFDKQESEAAKGSAAATSADTYGAAGVRILTNVCELGLEDAGLQRIVAYKLDAVRKFDLATAALEAVLEQRPEEPQSYRDLALVVARHAEAEGANGAADAATAATFLARARRVADLMVKVVKGKWDNRFNEVEVTALMELNAFLARMTRGRWGTVPGAEAIAVRSVSAAAAKTDAAIVEVALPEELLVNMCCDLRVSCGWDTDMTDIDLHVFEPTGEHAYYSHNRTATGGVVSRDFTRGYGPEEYFVRHAIKGRYRIEAKYYSNSRQDLTGATTILLKLFTDWGRPEQQRKLVVVRLTTTKEQTEVGAIDMTGQNYGVRVDAEEKVVTMAPASAAQAMPPVPPAVK